MKQRIFLIFVLLLLGFVLIGLNAASYVQKEKIPDNEFRPNRSTFNSGATGTRAYYELLAESGYKVRRWREPLRRSFRIFDETKVSTFVVIGKIRREFTEDEKTVLLDWVSSGGRLVVIDREPVEDLISTTANWSITFNTEQSLSGGEEIFLRNVDPRNQVQMTADVKAAVPHQPTIFTHALNSVQPSKFASSIQITRLDDGSRKDTYEKSVDSISGTESHLFQQPPPPAVITRKKDEEPVEEWDGSLVAPVVHYANDEKPLLVDFPFGSGQIVFLSDPYIVANGGIKLADNVQAAINLVSGRRGVIAFDEYHQGFGNNENLVLAYFSGTPVVALFLQIIAIFGLLFFSQSRRFARALPLREKNRLSKLEYVSAMAQLQHRTKGYDIAIENIYQDFRRRVSRLVGVDNHSVSRDELAHLIGERVDQPSDEIKDLLFKCEDISLGEPTNRKEIVILTKRIRELELKLGLRRSNKRVVRGRQR